MNLIFHSTVIVPRFHRGNINFVAVCIKQIHPSRHRPQQLLSTVTKWAIHQQLLFGINIIFRSTVIVPRFHRGYINFVAVCIKQIHPSRHRPQQHLSTVTNWDIHRQL